MTVCFTNLPVEFDEEGNPYLDEQEAETVERPDAEADVDYDDMDKVGCVEGDPGKPLADTDPEEAYGSILAELPEDARERVAESDESADAGSYQRSAEGD